MSCTHPHRTSGSSLPANLPTANLPTALPHQLADSVTCIQHCGNLWNQSCNYGNVSTLSVLQQSQQDGALVMWPVLVKPVVLLALLPLFLLSWLFCYFLHSSDSYPLLIFIEFCHLSSASSFPLNVFHNKHRRRNKPVIYFCAHPLRCILSMKFNLAAAAVLIA